MCVHTQKGERDGSSSDRPERGLSRRLHSTSAGVKVGLRHFPGGPVLKNPPSNAPENKFACEAQGTSVIENSFQSVAQATPLHELGLGYVVSLQLTCCRSWGHLAHLRHRFLASYFIPVSDYRSQVTGINPLEHRMNGGPHQDCWEKYQ